MSRPRRFGSLPTIVVLIVVLLAGSRLMYLSVQHHAEAARETAATVAAGFAKRIEPPLQRLAERAAGEAAPPVRASAAVSTAGTQAPAQARPVGDATGTDTFRMNSDDTVGYASTAQSVMANGIASEWRSAESGRTLAAAALLGPMRLGSEWIVAARAPLSSGPAAAAHPAFAVAYADLEDLIAEAHLAHLGDMGYDFQLSQLMPRSSLARIFVSSRAEPLNDAVAARVRLPLAAAIPGSYLEVAIRPRTGWYPASLLASDIALLVFVAWLMAFGTHDLIHALQRSREALAGARRRLHSVNQKLAAEMQQRLNLQETFDHARFHDAFTGLPNRRYFMDRLDRAMRDVRTKQLPRIAVIIIDIARFKLINDMLGHTAADELMVQAARRFEKSTAFEGVLARWGGDQFALLLLKVDSTDDALNIAALLQEELRSPFQLRRHQLMIAATVGVTLVDSGQQRAEDVVREADIALSVAKRNESTKIVLYMPNMGGQAANIVSLEADLHVALEKHQLRLLLQPIVDLRTYRMVGAEALLRWRHPVESVLAPDRFLRIAEEAGLMVPITRWVILRVIKMAGDWRRRLPDGQNFYISINLSPTALRDPGLAEYVGALLRETELPPSLLKFELTEAALIGNVGAARETLERLHALGVQLMLDDFGTGYSSLSNLQLFPFDFVKIDRPFVNLTGADQANTGMMAAMVQMATSLNLTAIAEIIEAEAAASALQQMGCYFGQGYYFSEPIEAEIALQRLNSQEPFQPHTASPGMEEALRGDSSPTVMVPPLSSDPSPTIMVRRLSDAASGLIVPPLPDALLPAIVTASPEDSSPTLMVLPLSEDSSPTLMVRPLMEELAHDVAAPAPPDHSPTMIVQPLTENSSPTLMVRPLMEEPAHDVAAPSPAEPPERPERPEPPEDSSPTAIMPPLREILARGPTRSEPGSASAATVPSAWPRRDDDSPTIMIPAGSLDHLDKDDPE